MVSYVEALTLLKKVASGRNLGSETLPLLDCVNRVVAEDILSPEQVPSFDNSAMDGFAVKSAITQNASETHPLKFRVLGTVAAGDVPLETSDSYATFEIMTGAPFPAGFDACIKIEDVIATKDSTGQICEIEIRTPAKLRQNMRLQGEDFKIGDGILKTGQTLHPESVLSLASLGITQVPVKRRPRIGLISTGRELVSMEEKISPGKIRNSNAPFIQAALKARGFEVSILGTVPDDASQFIKIVESAISERYDLILSTGAVSVGKFDFVKEAYEKLGAEFYFQKVAIRPGKPLIFGQIPKGPLFLGFPGNPVSGAVALRFFLDPLLRAWLGQSQEKPVKAILRNDFKKPEGLRCFYKSQVSGARTTFESKILSGQNSFMVSPLLLTNAWAVLPENGNGISAGTEVEVYPLLPGDFSWGANIS